ncbi:MAG: hypothetical protein ACREV3_04540 [Gammaproteobacteria bacterium]
MHKCTRLKGRRNPTLETLRSLYSAIPRLEAAEREQGDYEQTVLVQVRERRRKLSKVMLAQLEKALASNADLSPTDQRRKLIIASY